MNDYEQEKASRILSMRTNQVLQRWLYIGMGFAAGVLAMPWLLRLWFR